MDNPFAEVEQKGREYPISVVNLFLFGVVAGLIVLAVVRLHKDYLTRSRLVESKVNLRSINTSLELFWTPTELYSRNGENPTPGLPEASPGPAAPAADTSATY